MTVAAPPGLKGLPAGFDPVAYLELNPDVAAAGIPAEAHWLAHGRAEGRVWRADPLPEDFDPALYLVLNPELREAGVDPALHYRVFGRREGRFHRAPDPRARRHDPLVVFVHVPKTAGSSINEVLFRRLGPGIRHAEALEGHDWVLAQQLAQSGWISGHLSPDRMRRMLDGLTDRRLRLFSLLRRPIDQVASACNWLLVQHWRGRAARLAMRPETRSAAEDLAATDLSDPARLMALLDRHRDQLLNTQCRMLFGPGAAGMTPEEMRRGLSMFESVRMQDQIGLLGAEMTGTPGVEIPRENASPYLFDRRVFRCRAVVDFLARTNAADERLVAILGAGAAAPSKGG